MNREPDHLSSEADGIHDCGYRLQNIGPRELGKTGRKKEEMLEMNYLLSCSSPVTESTENVTF